MNLKERLNLPSSQEIAYVLKHLPKKERIIFLALVAIFVGSILLFLWQANNKISVIIPERGGTLKEGIIGTPRFINPLLAISDADRDMATLIYSGLMRPDNKGGLEMDLAEKYEISNDGLEYTFTLKPNLVWHNGEPIISDDIIFTVQQAKDPMLKSAKRAGWEGVTAQKIDDRTLKFILEKPYTPFLESTTLGILPKHLWKEASSDLMSFSGLNINPVGSGPYKIKSVSRDSSGIISSATLEANKKFALGVPFMDNISIKFYPSEEKLLNAYRSREIDGVGAVTPQSLEAIKRGDSNIKIFSLPRIFGVFFNKNSAKIFAQKEVRQALETATDKKKIIDEALKGFGTRLDYPIPPGTIGALPAKNTSSSVDDAKKLLEKNGWKIGGDGVYEKKISRSETLRLNFSISTSNVPELKTAAELVKSMWEKIGARVEVKVFEIGDLNQNIIRPRKYDALLFGEVVGRDPDPFVFWHSSQRNDPGLNIAMYTNITVDKFLEKARAISDEEKRKEIYGQFQEEIEKDVPAVFLYSPYFIYIAPQSLKGIENLESITIPSERFSQAHKWYLVTGKVWKIFVKKEN
ncbi:MAG: peptide ABC transporter substrate-binding protein [Candidatus Paceibacterota bacterium]